MIPSKREVMILNILDERGVITVDEICTYCGCSKETARRDLRSLEETRRIIRTHGGAKRADFGSAAPAIVDLATLMKARVALLDRTEVLIVTSSETAASQFLVDRATRAGVPVIAEGRHCPGATSVVVIDNYQAGLELGRWAGEYARQNMDGPVKVLDVGYLGSSTDARSQGLVHGLLGTVHQDHKLFHVNGQGIREVAQQCTADVLAIHPDINIVFGVNDDSALGALDAYRAAGIDDSSLLIVSFGLEGDEIRDLLYQDGPLKACVALFPELVGRACINAAICAHHGHSLPEIIAPPRIIVTADTLQDYYDCQGDSGEWQLKLEAAEQIPNVSPHYAVLNQCKVNTAPSLVGYVQNFSKHAYYQNFLNTIQSYARQKQIALEIIDASQDAVKELERLKRAIGLAAARMVNEGDTIILDAGYSTQSLAHALRDKKDITVITNSILVIQELLDITDITLISSGGVLRHQSKSYVGYKAVGIFKELRADKAFIGAAGASLGFGISNSNIDEATVKRAIIDAAREVVLLADYTKIGVASLIQVAPLVEVNHLVTNPEISEHDRLQFAQEGLNVIIADDGLPVV